MVSCASYPKKQDFVKQALVISSLRNPYFSNPNQDYVYKANIEVYGRTFGGIFIVKKLGNQNHRIVFTTEMGTKMFDFSFINDEFKVNYIMDELNKNILINILKNDFKALIADPIEIKNSYQSKGNTVFETEILKKTYFYYHSERLDKIIRTANGNEKVNFMFSESNDSIAKHIQILHSNIQLKINLRSLY